MAPNTSYIEDSSNNQLGKTQGELASHLTGGTFSHPALNRIAHSLNKQQEFGIETQITSYDRMHHRHNRS